MQNSIHVFTDGGCSPNPGTGAWGFVVVDGQKKMFSNSGMEKNTTNNRMELRGILEALLFIESQSVPRSFLVHSDSMLCVQSLNEWAFKWKQRRWKKKKPLKNLDLIIPAFELLHSMEHVKLKWVKGHSGNYWNDLVDGLCSEILFKEKKICQQEEKLKTAFVEP